MSNTNITLTKDEKEIVDIVKYVIQTYSPSTKAFIAGGWTRDKLLEKPSNDIDIMIDNMSGEDFANLVTKHLQSKSPHKIKSNPEKSKNITTAKAYIPLSSGKTQEIDFAQARKETYTGTSRIPSIKEATPEEDAHRRDLTINSIFYCINDNKIYDYTGKGLKDLQTMTIRTPQDPLITFHEDPLRIFRVLRFSSKYSGQIDPETYKAMQDPSLKNEIKTKVSKERIGEEIKKMLQGPNPIKAIELLKDLGLWQDIIKEAIKGTEYENNLKDLDMDQNSKHHNLNLWGHTLQAIKNVINHYENADPETRMAVIMATLLHDLGKTYTKIQGESKSSPGSTSYHGHEDESKKLSELILKYLKLEPYIKQVSGIADKHMRPHSLADDPNMKSLRRFIRQLSEQSLNWLDVFNVAMADALAKDINIDPETVQKYTFLKNKLQEAQDSMNFNPKSKIQPILNGNEIMATLDIKPGPIMTEITNYVKDLQDENPNITKDEVKNQILQKYKKASKNKLNQKTINVCPKHLLIQRKKDIKKAIKSHKPYQVLSIIKTLSEEYNDEDSIHVIALNMFKLILVDKKYKDNDVLQAIFDNAEYNFFDPILNSIVFGILLTIKTPTEPKNIKAIGKRMKKMAPKLLKTILKTLPKDIFHKKIKNQFLKK